MQRLLLVSHYEQKTNLNFLKCLTDLQFNFSNVVVPHNLFRNFKSNSEYICKVHTYNVYLPGFPRPTKHKTKQISEYIETSLNKILH